jgi:hypothetical protein
MSAEKSEKCQSRWKTTKARVKNSQMKRWKYLKADFKDTFLLFKPEVYARQMKDLEDKELVDMYNFKVKQSSKYALKAPAAVTFSVFTLGATAPFAVLYGRRFYLNVRQTRIIKRELNNRNIKTRVRKRDWMLGLGMGSIGIGAKGVNLGVLG